MSAVESRAADAAPADGPADLVEAAKDDHETHMTYDESSRVPWWVVAVWVVSFTGFALYCAGYLFPDLAGWGAP